MSYSNCFSMSMVQLDMTKFLFTKGHKHRPSTLKKLSDAKIGSKNPMWKGGRISDGHGYIKLKIAPKKYRLEHRVIMEEHIGRKLNKYEHVHHINGIKNDNRLENLIILLKSDHHKIHRINKSCVICGKPHRAKGLCAVHYNYYRIKGLF